MGMQNIGAENVGCKILACRIWAVSYTHLDVYKRQVQDADPAIQAHLPYVKRVIALEKSKTFAWIYSTAQ